MKSIIVALTLSLLMGCATTQGSSKDKENDHRALWIAIGLVTAAVIISADDSGSAPTCDTHFIVRPGDSSSGPIQTCR